MWRISRIAGASCCGDPGGAVAASAAMIRPWREGWRGSQPAPKGGGDRAQNETEGDGIVPAKRFTQVDVRKHREDDERDDLLNDFQLVASELTVAYPVRGHLKAVLAKRDEPTDDDGNEERRGTVLQVPVPRDSHEGVGYQEEQHSEHDCSRYHGELDATAPLTRGGGSSVSIQAERLFTSPATSLPSGLLRFRLVR